MCVCVCACISECADSHACEGRGEALGILGSGLPFWRLTFSDFEPVESSNLSVQQAPASRLPPPPRSALDVQAHASMLGFFCKMWVWGLELGLAQQALCLAY